MKRDRTRSQFVNGLIAIFLFGSLWGLSEVVLSGAISRAGIPNRSAILVGVGMIIMGIAMGVFRRPLMLLWITIVTILSKQLVVPILHISVMCKINSCLAVLLEGFILAGFVTVLYKTDLSRMISGGLAALLAAIGFYFIGMRLAPCPYLLSFKGELLKFLAKEGLVWAAFSGIFFPVGYRIGARLKTTVITVEIRRPLLYYISSLAVTAACWTVSALAIAERL